METTNTMYTRPATLLERAMGYFWRLKFRWNRHLRKSRERQMQMQMQMPKPEPRFKRIITEIRYE